MILTGSEIQKQIDLKKITIDPFTPKNINPNSYDLTLNENYKVYKNKYLSAFQENETVSGIIPDYGLLLKPGKLYLMRTNEKTHTDYYAPMIEGRSSIARLGVFIHITAGFGDVGFNGYWTLEVTVLHPIYLNKNMRIAQVYFHTLQGDTDILYAGKYQNNTDVQASKLYLDLEI